MESCIGYFLYWNYIYIYIYFFLYLHVVNNLDNILKPKIKNEMYQIHHLPIIIIIININITGFITNNLYSSTSRHRYYQAHVFVFLINLNV